jgi:hypothetical protein
MSSYYPDFDIPFDEPLDPTPELTDAQIEDTVHCDLCGAGYDIGGNGEGICINSPHHRNDPIGPTSGGQIKLCIDCALFAALTLKQALAEKDICEHGVVSGEWCEPCNRAYKQARIDNGDAE